LSFLMLLLGAASATAGDRLAVFEFFGRQGCSICSSAGHALTTLQYEMRGEAILLEYDYDGFPNGRQDRFWASGASATYLPLVMVGSGYRTSSGPVDFEEVFRSMIDDELERPARAAVSGFWRRIANTMRAYVEVKNLGDTDLRLDREAAVWLIAYENASVGHSLTWVRTTAVRFLPFDLAPGETTTMIFDSAPMSGVDWNNIAAVVMVEDRPSRSGPYDMLQACEAVPAALIATPNALEMSRRESETEIMLTGPHVLSWSATADVPWLDVTPSSGGLPAKVTLTTDPGWWSGAGAAGTVTFSATGDGMDFTETVTVAVGGPRHRWKPLRVLAPTGPKRP
jgi:hypothetical protein